VLQFLFISFQNTRRLKIFQLDMAELDHNGLLVNLQHGFKIYCAT